MARKLIIGGATVNQTPIHWASNTANIVEAIAEARKQRVDILCFPEMSIVGYGSEDLFLSEWVPERAFEELLKIRDACDEIVVCVGLPVRIGSNTYNGACVIDNKKILGITFKQNLARDGVHYEPRWFTAWPRDETAVLEKAGETIPVGDIIYETRGIRFGFEICEDGWRVDRPGYRLHQRKVDLILNPSASHFAMGKSELREKQVVMDGSYKFACAYLFVNLLGNEAGRMIYDGDIIFAQCGQLVAINKRLSFRNYNLLTCTFDFDRLSEPRALNSHDSKDRNEELVRATSLALFDYLRKSRARGFVLSLSGGADSSCCAILVAEMVRRASDELGLETFCDKLGLPRVRDARTAVGMLLTCAYQGTRNSSDATLRAAKDVADSIGATFYHWTIDEVVARYQEEIERALGRALTWEQDDIALQNIQARGRSPVIWLLANVKQSILLTTSNRSEGDVGYATMDGDTSGSLAPIAGIDKPFLLQWLKWAEQTLGYSGLHAVNNLQPTAELRPLDRTQTDEKDLMPYPVLRAIEKLAIYDRQPPRRIYEQLAGTYSDKQALKGHIRKFFKLWSANQWKRERFAPSFHLDDWNVDPRSWCRFPILSGNFESELQALDATP